MQTVRPAGESQNTKQTLLSDYGISSSPKAAKVEAGSARHGPLVEVKLEPGLPPKVGRLEDGRRGSEEGGKRKLTGCRLCFQFVNLIQSCFNLLKTGAEMQHSVLGSSHAVVSAVLAMSTILPAPIANVRGAGTRTGDFQIVAILGVNCALCMHTGATVHCACTRVPFVLIFQSG